MKLVRRVAAGAALSLIASVGIAQSAEAQAPLEIDLTQVDALIVQVQDTVLSAAAQLGALTEDLGQQPGVNEVLSTVGYLMTDGLIDLIQAFIDLVNGG